ncbi:MAG: hypothetical protein QXV28_08905 [Ignisphaera sp.]
MSVVYSVKISFEDEDSKEKRKKEVEEFIHRYKNFMNPIALSTVDSITMYEFKRQAREFLNDRSIDNYFKNIIRQMELNVKSEEERREFIIYEMSYNPVWYF